jgi:structural maintenance of chromosome 4
VNGEHQMIAKQLDKANTEFREFERKDIKYRWGGSGRAGGWHGGIGTAARWACQVPRLVHSTAAACPLALPCMRCREDLKHLKAKLKKLEDKMAKDGSKGQELAAELARLQEDVPALQARAADLELQLGKAQEVGARVLSGI